MGVRKDGESETLPTTTEVEIGVQCQECSQAQDGMCADCFKEQQDKFT